jgi:hypothetical protein
MISATVPIIRGVPVTTGRRRAFAAMPATPMTKAAETSVTPTTSDDGMPNPGNSLSMSSRAPNPNAATPPMPSAP